MSNSGNAFMDSRGNFVKTADYRAMLIRYICVANAVDKRCGDLGYLRKTACAFTADEWRELKVLATEGGIEFESYKRNQKEKGNEPCNP